MSAQLQIRGVRKRFGEVVALSEMDLDIEAGEFFSLLGPSGCGKTTLLRLIAGFEMPDAGSILLDGEDLTKLPAYKRPVNTVFQQYALFPHMTVFENVAFGLRQRKVPDGEVRERVTEALAQVRLEKMADRASTALSGGQRQRVALARALVLRPKILLLDEPLSALDHKLRIEMQTELRQLQHSCGITFIFVTHDQDEALTLSDRLAVMSGGKMEQLGRPNELYERPRTLFVARFLGASNLLPATAEPEGAALRVSIQGGPSVKVTGVDLSRHGPVTLLLRPEWLSLRREAPTGEGWCSWPVEVVDRTYHGPRVGWIVKGLGAEPMTVTDSPLAGGEDLGRGEHAHLCWREGVGALPEAK